MIIIILCENTVSVPFVQTFKVSKIGFASFVSKRHVQHFMLA